MPDDECVEFLQWALPRLRKRWPGYRRVRRQVCRRVRQRAGELGLDGLAAYRERLERDPQEWAVLDSLTGVTISRFGRDRAVFACLEAEVLPAVARGRDSVRAWSAGCASGEEPYSLAIAWLLGVRPGSAASRGDPADGPTGARRLDGPSAAPRLDVLATDVDPALLARAAEACYSPSSVKELEEARRREAFESRGGRLCVRDRFRRPVRFAAHDLRDDPPEGPFDIVLCRNLAFTYFDENLQAEVLAKIAAVTRAGGALVIGGHEKLPAGDFEPWPSARSVYRRRD